MSTYARPALSTSRISDAEETTPVSRRLAGVALVVLAAEFMTAIMLGASMAAGYELNAGAISDLGVAPETALLFNGSLVFIGLLNVLAGFALYRSLGRPWLLAMFILAGLGAVGAGLFPLSTGDLHSLFALLAFLFFNVETLACAVVVAGPIRPIAAVLGTIGLGFVVVMAIGDSGNPAIFGAIGHGGAERMIVYPPMIWLMAFGGYLLGREH
ncbi:MAG TPA: DUF998 domain-containing protein [Candidatus Limnocylindria bacterium]